jgi:guanylate kinase
LNETTRNGSLFIVSGPSGAGKSALVGRVLGLVSNVRFSVSYTTRAPRGAERHGVEYNFISRDEFQNLIDGNDLLEWAEVHGNRYGTSGGFVESILQNGEDVLLDIDVQGARTVREKRADAVGIFILPPSFQALRERLERRSLDDGIVIEQRLRRARKEINHYGEYDYLIVNRELQSSTRELESIIRSTRCRMAAQIAAAKSIAATFGGMNAEDP